MMKIHIDKFIHNTPDLSLEDVVTDIKAGLTKEGTINVHLKTVDKYVMISANGTTYGPDFEGAVIDIHPYISLPEHGYKELSEVDYDAYLAHPDYYWLSLVVDNGSKWGYYESVVTPLKHEYFVSYVPDSMVINYDCLEDVELIEWVDKE
jgi:hypothetical protein